jgi:hypothetical protein
MKDHLDQEVIVGDKVLFVPVNISNQQTLGTVARVNSTNIFVEYDRRTAVISPGCFVVVTKQFS